MTGYTTEAFYLRDYLCGRQAVITAAFEFYARAATQKIKLYTFDNVDENNIPEAVKMCCCEIAEKLYSYERSGGEAGVASESVGGWSKSFESAEAKHRALDVCVRDIVYKWLTGTGLLYRGC